MERIGHGKPPKKLKPEEIETEPDAWERFEKTIGEIVPQKRPAPRNGGSKKTKGGTRRQGSVKN